MVSVENGQLRVFFLNIFLITPKQIRPYKLILELLFVIATNFKLSSLQSESRANLFKTHLNTFNKRYLLVESSSSGLKNHNSYGKLNSLMSEKRKEKRMLNTHVLNTFGIVRLP